MLTSWEDRWHQNHTTATLKFSLRPSPSSQTGFPTGIHAPSAAPNPRSACQVCPGPRAANRRSRTTGILQATRRLKAASSCTPTRGTHPASVRLLRHHLFDRSECLQGPLAFRRRFVDCKFARNHFQKPPTGQQTQIRHNRSEIQVWLVDHVGFGYSGFQAYFEDLGDDLICISWGHQHQ